MITRRILLLTVLTALALTVFTACGGAGGGDMSNGDGKQPESFNVSAVSPDIGMIGDAVTITGEGLDNATIVLGETEIVPDSHSATKITLTIPGTANSGPQSLTVSKEGVTADFDFFVGTDFPAPATLEDLAALALPAGTAVRLGAGTYTSSGPVTLENLSLFGVSSTDTIFDIVSFGDDPDGALVLAMDLDSQLVVQGIGFQLGQLLLAERTEGDVFAPFSVSGAVGLPENDVLATALAVEPSAHSGSLTLKSIAVTDSGDGAVSAILSMTNNGLFPIATHIIDSQIGGELIVALGSGALSLTDTEIEVIYLSLGSLFAPLEITAVEAAAHFDEDSTLEIYSQRGLEMRDSQLSSTGSMQVSLPSTSNEMFALSSSVVADSSFVVRNLGSGGFDNPGFPAFEFHVESGVASFENVDFEIAGVSYFILGGFKPEVSINESQFTLGSLDDTGYFSPLWFAVEDFAKNDSAGELLDINTANIALSDTEVTFEGAGGIGVFADDIAEPDFVEFVFEDNEINGSLVSTAIFDSAFHIDIETLDGDVGLAMSGNTVTGFEKAFAFYASFMPNGQLTGAINDNIFDLDFDLSDPGAVASLPTLTTADSYIDARNNTWGTFTNAADVQGLIDGDLNVFDVDPITLVP